MKCKRDPNFTSKKEIPKEQAASKFGKDEKDAVRELGQLHSVHFLGPLTTSWPFEMGVSLNGGTPISHPKIIIFRRKNQWASWGNPPF